MELISMTDYVLSEHEKPYNSIEFLSKVTKYAKFLKRPLELGMFVPCKDGVVLEEPRILKTLLNHPVGTNKEVDEWREAKDRVLFEGFEYLHAKKREWCRIRHGNGFISGLNFLKHTSIEYFVGRNVTLTPKAIEQL